MSSISFSKERQLLKESYEVAPHILVCMTITRRVFFKFRTPSPAQKFLFMTFGANQRNCTFKEYSGSATENLMYQWIAWVSGIFFNMIFILEYFKIYKVVAKIVQRILIYPLPSFPNVYILHNQGKSPKLRN